MTNATNMILGIVRLLVRAILESDNDERKLWTA